MAFVSTQGVAVFFPGGEIRYGGHIYFRTDTSFVTELLVQASRGNLGSGEQITCPPTHGERLALADRYVVLPAGSHRAARRAGILFLCRCPIEIVVSTSSLGTVSTNGTKGTGIPYDSRQFAVRMTRILGSACRVLEGNSGLPKRRRKFAATPYGTDRVSVS
jgi:hypothetical protein